MQNEGPRPLKLSDIKPSPDPPSVTGQKYKAKVVYVTDSEDEATDPQTTKTTTKQHKEPVSTVPATISEDNTNKDLVLENLLKPMASRQSQDLVNLQRLHGTSSIPLYSYHSGRHHPTPSPHPPQLSSTYRPTSPYTRNVDSAGHMESTPQSNIYNNDHEAASKRITVTLASQKKVKNYYNNVGSNHRENSSQYNIASGLVIAGSEVSAIEQAQNKITNNTKLDSIDLRASHIDIIEQNSVSENRFANLHKNTESASANCCSESVHPGDAPPFMLKIFDGIEKIDEVSSLQEKIRQLESRVAELQKPHLPEKQILYRILCGAKGLPIWLDEPRIRDTRKDNQHYEADIPIPDQKAYFERNTHIHFVIYRDFVCCEHLEIEEKPIREDFFGPPRLHAYDQLGDGIQQNPFSIISKELSDLLKRLQNKVKIPDWSDGFKIHNYIYGPHHYALHNLGLIRNRIRNFNPLQQCLLNLPFDHIEETYGAEFREATELFNQGYVSRQGLCYLIRPEDVIIAQRGNYHLDAYIVGKWPSVDSDGISFMAWSWGFNGFFQKNEIELSISLKTAFGDSDIIDITKLPYYPLKYADLDSRKLLEKRGSAFWRCRYRHFVGYSGWDGDNNDYFDNVRFMIDTTTYRRMHPESSLAKSFSDYPVDDLGDRMGSELPLEGDQLLVFPPTIYGFHVQEKKWFNLRVDNLTDVVWNKAAFDSLVIDEDTKLLIVALVSNKIAADANTDIITNKGNGLVILLHGAPGTGKTLTAESVAEYAEKPLYRVTTGDVGTDPIAVEKYLESVLYLGKIWGCIVLLDEADVFLEERTLSDLTRNALVSVFLRVLEYYNGIIILTSNRVGTFDSAFKSRIQLAIHYDNLSHSQRIKIWQGFIKRLEDVAYDQIDIDELSLDKNIKKLAKHDLNGRQIRNNITTARQLALYKKERMNTGHLETVIQVSQKFETYLRDVKAGLDDNQIAREDGLR